MDSQAQAAVTSTVESTPLSIVPSVKKNPCTDRQIELMRFLAEGWSNPMIAQTLGITKETVKSALRDLARKLEVRSRIQIVVLALRNHWID